MKASGKAHYRHEELGQGDLRGCADDVLLQALGVLDALTIGDESKEEQEDLIRRSQLHKQLASG